MIGGASLGKENLTVKLARQYIQYFYMSDPNLNLIGEKESDPAQSPLLLKLHASQINNPAYREQIYERHNLNERLSWLGQMPGLWYAVNMYRETSSKNISAEELDRLREIGPCIIACVEKHLSIISPAVWEAGEQPSIEWFEDLIRELGNGLAPREIQVCARALHGMTRTGIGLDLEIKPTTVNTLTQRAYDKLNISTLNELFALCLRALALRNDRQSV